MDYEEFKILIMTYPEEPEIIEHNFYEDFLEQKKKAEEQKDTKSQIPEKNNVENLRAPEEIQNRSIFGDLPNQSEHSPIIENLSFPPSHADFSQPLPPSEPQSARNHPSAIIQPETTSILPARPKMNFISELPQEPAPVAAASRPSYTSTGAVENTPLWLRNPSSGPSTPLNRTFQPSKPQNSNSRKFIVPISPSLSKSDVRNSPLQSKLLNSSLYNATANKLQIKRPEQTLTQLNRSQNLNSQNPSQLSQPSPLNDSSAERGLQKVRSSPRNVSKAQLVEENSELVRHLPRPFRPLAPSGRLTSPPGQTTQPLLNTTAGIRQDRKELLQMKEKMDKFKQDYFQKARRNDKHLVLAESRLQRISQKVGNDDGLGPDSGLKIDMAAISGLAPIEIVPKPYKHFLREINKEYGSGMVKVTLVYH